MHIKSDKQKIFKIVLLVVIFIAGIVVAYIAGQKSVSNDVYVPVVKDDVVIESQVLPPAPEEVRTLRGYSGALLAGEKTPLLDFNKEDYEKALADDKIIFLYFYTIDCPKCLIDKKPMYEAFDSMESSKIIGFRVNYADEATDLYEGKLAYDFKIEGSHTKVVLKDSTMVLKSSSTWNKNDYVRQIAQFLDE
jgi:thiol-disulfide isomerase/thioredoxin